MQDVFLYRKDRRWQKFSKIDEIVLTGDSEPDLNVWSSEYRDLFGNTTDLLAGLDIGSPQYAVKTPFSASVAVIPSSFLGGALTSIAFGTRDGGLAVRGTNDLSVAISDEISHTDLRQSVLKKTHWRFRQANNATPTYLYATWADGDQISNNPPETI
jgi:hypothetical protein